jgi:hypothetical protein
LCIEVFDLIYQLYERQRFFKELVKDFGFFQRCEISIGMAYMVHYAHIAKVYVFKLAIKSDWVIQVIFAVDDGSIHFF